MWTLVNVVFAPKRATKSAVYEMTWKSAEDVQLILSVPSASLLTTGWTSPSWPSIENVSRIQQTVWPEDPREAPTINQAADQMVVMIDRLEQRGAGSPVFDQPSLPGMPSPSDGAGNPPTPH